VRHSLAPIGCKPWMLNGLSERLIVSHYENDYGAAVRSLNAIADELGSHDLAAMSDSQVRALKREELGARASVALHELYFGALGGDGATRFAGAGQGSSLDPALAAAIDEHFGSFAAWRHEFVRLAATLSHGSGWALLVYSRRDKQLFNQIVADHAQGMIDSVPLLVLDMYEHAYHIDFGANAAAYVDAFMRNIDWNVVGNRFVDARTSTRPAATSGDGDNIPSISVEDLANALADRDHAQVLDARPKHYFSRSTDMMSGAIWHDPERIDEWSGELSPDAPVYVYCAYGFGVGRGVTALLRERGFDARYVAGGLSAWYAVGGERALKPLGGA
jgi:superoxide dismutase, Fe-Mn family